MAKKKTSRKKSQIKRQTRKQQQNTGSYPYASVSGYLKATSSNRGFVEIRQAKITDHRKIPMVRDFFDIEDTIIFLGDTVEWKGEQISEGSMSDFAWHNGPEFEELWKVMQRLQRGYIHHLFSILEDAEINKVKLIGSSQSGLFPGGYGEYIQYGSKGGAMDKYWNSHVWCIGATPLHTAEVDTMLQVRDQFYDSQKARRKLTETIITERKKFVDGKFKQLADDGEHPYKEPDRKVRVPYAGESIWMRRGNYPYLGVGAIFNEFKKQSK